MEARKFEKILRSWIKRGEGPYAAINVTEAADEIAEACARDKADALEVLGEAWQDIEAERIAQIAEMRSLLNEAVSDSDDGMPAGICSDDQGQFCIYCDHYSGGFTDNVTHRDDCLVTRARAALAATPEVMWAGEAKVWHGVDTPGKSEILYTEIEIREKHIGRDGQSVKAIVLEEEEK